MSDADLLRQRNRFVAEGRLVVGRLIESGHRVDSVLLNDSALRALEPQLAHLSPDVPIFVCDTDEFAAITGFNLHRGCLASAERPAPRSLAGVLGTSDRVLVLESVADADNVGSAFRNAAAFGASVLLSATCCDPLYRKAIRTSMGSVLRTPYGRLDDWPRDLTSLKHDGFTLVALTLGDGAIDLTACARQPGRRLALLVGSEGNGLTAAAEAMADLRVRIPIRADVDSLNLATATGIALHYFAAPP